MGDAGGQRTEGLHFLAVHQLHLGHLQFAVAHGRPRFRREIAGDGFAMPPETGPRKQRGQTKTGEAHDQRGLYR